MSKPSAAIKVAWIGGFCTVVAAIIGAIATMSGACQKDPSEGKSTQPPTQASSGAAATSGDGNTASGGGVAIGKSTEAIVATHGATIHVGDVNRDDELLKTVVEQSKEIGRLKALLEKATDPDEKVEI